MSNNTNRHNTKLLFLALFLVLSSLGVLSQSMPHTSEQAMASPQPNENNTSTENTQLVYLEREQTFAAPPRRDVDTRLPGIFPRGARSLYKTDLDWIALRGISPWKRVRSGLKFVFGGGLSQLLRVTRAFYFRSIPATIYDARAKEAEEGLTKAEFFERYGFVVLNHTSAMEASDWSESDRNIAALLGAYGNRSKDGGSSYQAIIDDFRNGDTPVKRIYAKETTDLLRSILPRAKNVMGPSRGIRRYPTNNLNKGFAKQVHNDYGLDFDAVVERNPFFDFGSQKALYEEKQADEYMLVNLWRPIKPMSDSSELRSFPLCFLDPTTLQEGDFVEVDSASLGVVTALKENPEHRFYYYPDMTVNEVVVFKQFHQLRNETSARMPVFHTAFADPAADETTEDRVSFEYRVGILL